MTNSQKRVTPLEMLSVLLFAVGVFFSIITLFIDKTILSIQITGVGVLLLYISFYYLYKLIEKKVENKQALGALIISIMVSLTAFSGGSIFRFFEIAEESSINWRFSFLKGTPGKASVNTDTGYVEKVNEIPGARKDIRIIGIKTETLEKLQGTWPINWKKYADIIHSFRNTDNILLYDIFFMDYKKGEKEAMVEALSENRKVIFDYSVESTAASKSSVLNLEERQEKLRRFKLTNVVDEDRGVVWLEFAVPPIEQVTELSAGVGFANIKKDENTSNRKMPLVVKLTDHGPNKETEYYPSIDLIAICQYYGVDVVNDTEIVMGKYLKIKNIPKREVNGKDIMTKPNQNREIIVPIDDYGQMQINFVGSLYCFQDDDLYDVAEWGEEYASQYSNTIFLVAMYYATGRGASKDTHLSPYGEMSGIEHHAHAINTILNQDFLSTSGDFFNFFIFIFLGLMLGLIQPRVKTHIGFLVFFVTVIAYIILSCYVFINNNLIIPLPTVVIEQLMIFVGIISFKILTEEENVKYIRNTFSKFVSKDVVDELLKNPDLIQLGGSRREITVFFSDVRGFTTLSEALSPEELVKLLNEYLSVMTEIIIDYKGTIDKYMGDAIMAFWGAPVDLEDHAYYACVAALSQMKKLHELQSNWKARNLPSIDIGIGLNTGPAVVGNMGSAQRMDYTCMGDTVNLGSRLEGSNKTYTTNIIISEYTYERVKDRVYARELDLVQVKGKTHPVRIYELMGLINDEDMSKIKRPISIKS